MAPFFPLLITLILLYYGHRAVRWLLATRRPPGFPPGPPTALGLGNLHQIVSSRSTLFTSSPESEKGDPVYLRFTTWARQYGDIVGLKVGAANLVVLSHPRHVHALFDRRGAIYSGRVGNYGAEQYVLYGGRKQVIFLQNDACLRRWRAVIARHFLSQAAVEALSPILDAAATELAHDLLLLRRAHGSDGGDDGSDKDDDGQSFSRVFRRWSLGTSITTVAGACLEDCGGDAFAEHIFGIQEMWLEVLAPLSPATFVPLLKYLPEWLAPWKRKARLVREAMESYSAMLLRAGRRNRSSGGGGGGGGGGEAYRCFLAGVLDDVEEDERRDREAGSKAEDKYRFNDLDLAYMASGLVDATIDTTWSTTMSLVLLLAAHADMLRKIHEELDGIVAAENGTWPAPKVLLERIPYLRACLYEALRLRPPGPIALPHRLDQDDEYEGFHLPKGTIMVINAFGIQTDPRDFDDPDAFRPERYLQHPLGLRPDLPQTSIDSKTGATVEDGRRLTYTFGAGRRGCPGERYAITSILIAAARVFYAFDLQSMPGAPPFDLGVRTGFHPGLTMGPNPFSVSFVPRDEAKAALIEQEYQRLRPVLQAISQTTK